MMKLAKSRFKDRDERFRWVYSELDRLYPPILGDTGDAKPASVEASGSQNSDAAPNNEQASTDNGQIQGLGQIPEGWPELPANASLSSEVGWVQANRLRVVEERPGQATLIHLDQAHSPAPSWAALGWLETSIRSYAKYVDVAAKATARGDGEAEVWRRERMAIEEMGWTR